MATEINAEGKLAIAIVTTICLTIVAIVITVYIYNDRFYARVMTEKYCSTMVQSTPSGGFEEVWAPCDCRPNVEKK